MQQDQEHEDAAPLQGTRVAATHRRGAAANTDQGMRRRGAIQMPKRWVSGTQLLEDAASRARTRVNPLFQQDSRLATFQTTEGCGDADDNDENDAGDENDAELESDGAGGMARFTTSHDDTESANVLDDRRAVTNARRTGRVSAALTGATFFPLSPSASSNDSVGVSERDRGRSRSTRSSLSSAAPLGDPRNAYTPQRRASPPASRSRSVSRSVESRDDSVVSHDRPLYASVPHDDTKCGLCILKTVPLPRECEPDMLAVEDTIQSKLPSMRTPDATNMIYDLYWNVVRPSVARVFPQDYRQIVPRMTHAQIEAHLNSSACQNEVYEHNKLIEQYKALSNVLFDTIVYTVPVDPVGDDPDAGAMGDPYYAQQQQPRRETDYKNWAMFMATTKELTRLRTTDIRKLMPHLSEADLVRAQIQRQKNNAIVMPRYYAGAVLGISPQQQQQAQ